MGEGGWGFVLGGKSRIAILFVGLLRAGGRCYAKFCRRRIGGLEAPMMGKQYVYSSLSVSSNWEKLLSGRHLELLETVRDQIRTVRVLIVK